ncbi:MAG TPA: aminodeoxychorismate/anthranilate synthase component II [Terriglobales bacterium]|nr:aminodeoxychorismate/anthranilate synthase component II [Terriglobales bacterium]
MIFLLDNYDSFTFNLAQYFGELGEEVVVRRNDRTTVAEILELRPAALVISPGPCTPDQAGISVPAVRALAGQIPILGVCLGHQAIGQAFGARIVRAAAVMHGKTSAITHDERTIFQGLPNPFAATRYHSLVIQPESLPDCLEVSARTADQLIMGVRHRQWPVEGVQFHPESILTSEGKSLLLNFLRMYIRG